MINQILKIVGNTPFRVCVQCENEEAASVLFQKAKDAGMQVMISRSTFSDWDVVFTEITLDFDEKID